MFEQVGVERAVQIVDALRIGDELDIILEFRSLLETELVLGDSPFERTTGRILLNLGADASLFRVLDAMHTTFDLLESVRGMVDLLAVPTDGSAAPTPTPLVRHLEVSNPLELIIVGAWTVFVGVTVVASRVTDLFARAQSITHASKAEKREQELHPLRVQSLELDVIKKKVELGSIVEELSALTASTLGGELATPSPGDLARLQALKDQAVEAAVELQSISTTPMELSASPELIEPGAQPD